MKIYIFHSLWLVKYLWVSAFNVFQKCNQRSRNEWINIYVAKLMLLEITPGHFIFNTDF